MYKYVCIVNYHYYRRLQRLVCKKLYFVFFVCLQHWLNQHVQIHAQANLTDKAPIWMWEREKETEWNVESHRLHVYLMDNHWTQRANV